MVHKLHNWFHRKLVAVKLYVIENQVQLILISTALIIIIILLVTKVVS